jgi:hypothetical protein
MFNYFKFTLIGFLLMLLGSLEVLAFNTPCQWKYPRSLQRTSGEIAPSHCEILDLAIGTHTLQDVVNKLGKADIFRGKFGGTEEAMVCYVADKTENGASIVFSSGALGGWHTITGFIVAPYNLIPCYANECKEFQSKEHVGTKSGITLGIEKKKFIQIVGNPTHSDSDMIAYHYIGERRMTEDEIRKAEITFESKVKHPFWFVSSGIVAYFSYGKLAWFYVYKTVSY